MKGNYQQAKQLIVEEDNDHWDLIQQAMSRHLPDVETIRATSSTQAVSLLEGWQHQEWELPKLILMDLHLPTLSGGWQLISRIKTMQGCVNRIPALVFSSSTIQTDIEEAYRLGASSYLIKPTELVGWLKLIVDLRAYWWETVTLPPVQYGL